MVLESGEANWSLSQEGPVEPGVGTDQLVDSRELTNFKNINILGLSTVDKNGWVMKGLNWQNKAKILLKYAFTNPNCTLECYYGAIMLNYALTSMALTGELGKI